MPRSSIPSAATPQDLSAHVRQRIHEHLADLPVRPTQRAIGAAIRRTQTWVSHYLSGRHDIDLNTLGRLADFLGVTVPDLMAGAQPRHDASPRLTEAITMLRSISDDEQDTVLDILRILARVPSTRRARS